MLLTKVFVNRLKELEFVKKLDVDSDPGVIRAYDYNNAVLITVLMNEEQAYNTMFPAFRKLKSDQKQILMKYLTDYAQTPVVKRVEEKRYLVPVIPRVTYLNGKYLFKGRLGLSIRDLTLKELKNPKSIDSRFIFSEGKINRYKADPDIHLDFKDLIRVS